LRRCAGRAGCEGVPSSAFHRWGRDDSSVGGTLDSYRRGPQMRATVHLVGCSWGWVPAPRDEPVHRRPLTHNCTQRPQPGPALAGSGLSSSAAIVCSSMLAVLVTLGVQPSELDKAAVAEAACKVRGMVAPLRSFQLCSGRGGGLQAARCGLSARSSVVKRGRPPPCCAL
jgi:hypothetical protein